MMNSVRSKQDIITRLVENRAQIIDLGVRSLGLFGSFVRGDQKDQSDVDILVEFISGRKSFDRFMQLAFLLEDILGRTVELVTRESLSRHVGHRILRETEYVPLAA